MEKTTIQPQDRYTFGPHVEWQKFEDNALLLLLETGEIYQLNETSARIIELMEKSHTAQEILQHLLQEYQQEESTIEQEMHDFLSHCLQQSLLQHRAQ
ncbi:MAG: PqqD family protein [Deltaproteobacteria bacterium]|nr:MAG: PqqD family protein [Deltaproteobacteria bacterium]